MEEASRWEKIFARARDRMDGFCCLYIEVDEVDDARNTMCIILQGRSLVVK
jgi:hypothetical protein